MSRVGVLSFIAVILIVQGVGLAGEYSGGDGVAEPYRISTIEDWEELMVTSGHWDKQFVLTEDLDFEGAALTPVGSGSVPFSGVFDGQGHVISDFIIDLPSVNYVGLFGHVEQNGVIQKLGIEGINVIGNYGVGGLVGYNAGQISFCYAKGIVTGNLYVGGLAGEISPYSRLFSCYFMGEINGNSYVGGLVGGNYGNSSFCYAAASVDANNNKGSFVGYGMTPPFSFWDIEISGLSNANGGIGCSTSMMQDAETYLRAFWDFKGEMRNGVADIWAMPAGGGYPVLAWQLEESGVVNDEMSGAIGIAAGGVASGSSVGTTGLDLTLNGYRDFADVWYYFDCAEGGKYTISVEDADFNTTVGVFDEAQREVVFNDDFFGGKSVVILDAAGGRRYYVRVAGYDGQAGNFSLRVERGGVQAIQGDLNYDGAVDLVDFSVFAGQWLAGK